VKTTKISHRYFVQSLVVLQLDIEDATVSIRWRTNVPMVGFVNAALVTILVRTQRNWVMVQVRWSPLMRQLTPGSAVAGE
jgi:hypothetical protein